MPRKTKPRLKTLPHRFLPDGPLRRRISKILLSIAHALKTPDQSNEDVPTTIEQAGLEDELLLLLHRCHLLLRTTDSAASVAVQRANIEALLRLGRPPTDQDYRNLDGATQIRIGHHLPEGLISTETNELDDTTLRDAASVAKESLGIQTPGRPRDTDSLARAQFALGLAAIFKQVTGKPPGRSYSVEPGPRGNTTAGGEQGKFLEFIKAIVDTLPKPLRQRLKLEQLARIGIELLEQHPDGLIDEARFLT